MMPSERARWRDRLIAWWRRFVKRHVVDDVPAELDDECPGDQR